MAASLPTVAASQKETESLLLKLPAEIRNAIYAFAVVRDTPIELSVFEYRVHEPVLLAVNRQVRKKAMPVFYGGNTFSASWSRVTKEFFKALSDEKISMLRNVQTFGEGLWKGLCDLAIIAGQLRFTVEKAAGWRLMHEKRGLRPDAILVPLRVLRNDRYDIQWVPAPRVREWVPQVDGNQAIFVRKEELGLVDE